ncbi:hypothetical protein [Selenomonas ruminantium]|uniref:Uncharacterized protein n=1 Tax=Selenomonas ruminantium TaxID=971 RepID=A0A1I0YLN3_SELRU|nr:hypothetical protein [Selenomonas ruminantium]SFB13706.1 hypothetical protein SAMN05216587_11512 [Selenomonas ruminantium]
MKKMYGEIKVRKNFFPNDARELVAKDKIGFLLVQSKISEKTKAILDKGGIVVYENISIEVVSDIREKIKSKKK